MLKQFNSIFNENKDVTTKNLKFQRKLSLFNLGELDRFFY